MDLFTYLLGKKGHNTQRDVFSYLLGKGAGGSGTYVNFTGTSLNISNTLRARIKNITLKGATSQYTTTGKNLLYIENGSKTSNGITGVWENGIFTYSGKATGTYATIAGYTTTKKLLPGTYTFSIDHSVDVQVRFRYKPDINHDATIPIGSTSTTFTITEDTERMYIFINSLTVDKEYNEVIKCMIEEGSTATDFEEYTGGQPSPSPDYPQPIKVVTGDQIIDITEKNLIDASTNVTGYYINANGVITSGAGHNYTALIPVKQASYRFSGTQVRTDSNTKRIHGYDSNGNWVQQITIFEQTQGDYSKVFTVANENIKYIRLSYYQTDTFVILNQTYPINLGSLELAKIGDYQDYIYGSPNNWYKKSLIGKVVLDGRETWNYNSGNRYFFTNKFLDNYVTQCTKLVSNNYIGGVASSVGLYNNRIQTGTAYSIMLRDNRFTDKNDLKTWLSTHNTIVKYPLATPTTEPITDTTLIEQLNNLYNATSQEGTTIITCSSASDSNEIIVFSGDIKVTSVGNSLNTSLLSSNIQEKPNLDDVNETEDIEQNEEPIEEEVS